MYAQGDLDLPWINKLEDFERTIKAERRACATPVGAPEPGAVAHDQSV